MLELDLVLAANLTSLFAMQEHCFEMIWSVLEVSSKKVHVWALCTNIAWGFL